MKRNGIFEREGFKTNSNRKANLFVVSVSHLTEEPTAESPNFALLRHKERVRVSGVDLGNSIRRESVNLCDNVTLELETLYVFIIADLRFQHTTYRDRLKIGP